MRAHHLSCLPDPPLVHSSSCPCKPAMTERKRVLIAGAGFAGLQAARALQGAPFDVTVVDPKTYFDYVPAAPHSLVAPLSAQKNLIDLPVGRAQFKQGLVVGLTSDGARGTATLQGGETLEFDYAILATGSSYPAAIKPPSDRLTDRAARLQELSAAAEKIGAAKSVVVVGGGAVGVEMASEVAEAYPDKKVTLVCSGPLLPRLDAKVRQFSADWLQKHGVEVLTGESVTDWGGLGDGPPGPATLTTASGRSIAGDVVIKCVGVKPATALFAGSLAPDQLASNGSVAVEPTLQVKGWPNVFAAGDCSSTTEEKTAAFAGLAAGVAAGNIKALEAGKTLQTYPEGLFGGVAPPPVCGLSLGTKAGAFQMGGTVQTGSGPAKMKSIAGFIILRAMGGSGFWGAIYGALKSGMVGGIAREAKKAAAATPLPAPVAAAAAAT